MTELKIQKCRSCGADVYWIGNKIVDVQKKVIILPATGETISGHESHFATCPDAGKWRKKK